jgi:hypothetical protein
MRTQLGLSAEFDLDEADQTGDASWRHIGTSVVLFPRLEASEQ